MPQSNRDASLSERAAAAARAELRGERDSILGALGIAAAAPLSRARDVPERWTFLFVMERMAEGFRILSRLPLPTRPKGYVNSMPVHLYDQADLNSQLETYELERMARMRNRVRILPSPTEIGRMEEALFWPLGLFVRRRVSSPRPRRQSRRAVGRLRCRCRQGAQTHQADAAHVQCPQAARPAHHRARAHPPSRAGAVSAGSN